MPASPIENISESLQELGDEARLVEREYASCGIHREINCPVGFVRDIAQAFKQSDYYLEMMAATDCEGKASLSYTFNRFGAPDRTLVRLTFDYDSPVPSISDIFPGAEWNEREAWELVGVQFENHPGLKQLLLPEDADFNPLRKDFGIPKAIIAARQKAKKLKARKLAKEAKAKKEQEKVAKAEDDPAADKSPKPKDSQE